MASSGSVMGQQIREARLTAGLSQAALAESVGTTIRSITNWETGVWHPRVNTLARIAQVTERPIAWFYADPEKAAA